MVPTSDSDNPPAVRERSAVDKAMDSLFIPVQFCLVGLLLVGVYIGVIQGAWIPHRFDMSVWIQGDWQDGEYRSCQFLLPASRLFCGSWEGARHGGSLSEFISQVSNDDFTAAFNAAMTGSAESEWTSLGKYFHVLRVTFHGRFQRSDRDRVVMSWLCQRKDDALVCKAPN
jgi:hypothetical protein